ncbi:MAG TPA: hypothetical protein VIF12_03375 [Micavibrio sp.]
MGIKVKTTVSDGGQLTTFHVTGTPATAESEMIAEDLWNHYNGPDARKGGIEVETTVSDGGQVTTFHVTGKPVSAEREMTPDELWDFYNKPKTPKPQP